MAVSKINGNDLTEYVKWFRENADEVEVPALRAKALQVSNELGRLDRRLAGKSHEREQWTQKLDELQGALAACTTAAGVGSMCHPFYAKAERVIAECSKQDAAADRAAMASPSE